MAPLVIPPTKRPSLHPHRQPIILPPLIDKSCILALFPLRDDKWYDYSGYNNHGTIVGATWVSQGRRGPALSFDGVDDYVNLSDAGSEWDFQTFTVAFWIKTTDVSAEIMGEGTKWRPSINSSGYLVFWIRGLKAGADATDTLTSTKKINDGKLYHIVCTYDISTLKMKIFIDGELNNEKPTTVEIYASGSHNQAIGNGWAGGPIPVEAIIDEVLIFARVLTADEIKALYELGRGRA